MLKRLVIFLLCYFPLNAFAAIIFEFESSCTSFIRNTECAYFGLNSNDIVSGGFIVEDAFGSPGSISFLNNHQYEMIFKFGNQSFTELDAVSQLGFNVTAEGAGFSSILGNFQNANGAQLTFLTLSTVNISLHGFEADTFAGGGGWALAEDSDLFTKPVPLPASFWMLLSGLGVVGLRMYTK